ncbi:MAG: PAS domain-containing protein, partial [bacterium]
MAHGLKTAGLFDALAKETNEVITIAAPGDDADLAETKYVSPSITRVLGYGLGEPVSLRWADTVHPDDIERVAAMSREIRRVEG